MPILREKDLHDEFGEISPVPFHLPEHLLYALLMLLAALTVLWQNCHPGLTAAVILLTPVFALSAYIPYRFFNRFARLTAGILVFLAAVVWGRFRIMEGTPFDRIAAEMLALASLAFLAGGRSEYYGRSLAISLFWLIYGALFPRLLYLVLFTVSLLLILILLHLGRLRNLAGTGGKVKHQHAWKLTVFLFLIQGVIGGTIFWYVFTLLPIHPNQGKGLFEVSFLTDRDMAMPENFRSWMHGEKRERKGSEEGTEEQEGAGFAKTISLQGTRVAAVKNIRTSSSVMGAGSAAPPSDELIFRCRMPGKLYHTANLFDRYDGVKWTHSPKFLELRKFRLLRGELPQVTIEAKYTVYHLLSRRLCSPFMPVIFTGEDNDVPIHTIDRALGAELSDTLKIPLPLRYKSLVSLFAHTDQGFRGKDANRILSRLEKISVSLPGNPRIISRKNRFYPAPSHHYPNWGISEADALFHRHIRGRCLRGFELPSPLSVPTVQKPYCCILTPILKEPWFSERRVYTSPSQWKRSLLYGRPVPGTVNLLRKKDRSPLSENLQRNPLMETKCVPDSWIEPIPRSHYLQLPQGKMRPSVRLRQLVRSLTAGKEGPYQKALAIRDWLRHNKSYEMFSEPLPKGRETVDRFVFEMDSGHCEYFACAMTLMARLAGLPARIAIGFSPGDYNTLTDQFEVRAYHSHAWSQVFIEGAGWLTFDAVPPGNVISRTRPFGIGRFRDPFGDEWKVEPPELTRNLRKVVADKVLEMQKQEAGMLEEEEKNALTELAEVRDKLADKIRQQYQSSDPGQEGISDSEKEAFLSPKNIRLFINSLSFRLMRAYFSGQQWILRNLPLLFSFGVLAAVLCVTGKILRMYRTLRRRIRTVRHHLNQGRDLLKKEPRASVRESYLAVRHLLLLMGKRRKMREDLSAYLLSAAGTDTEFSRNLQTLCDEFIQAEYSGKTVLPETAQKVLKTAEICAELVGKDLKIQILSRDFRSVPEGN